MHAARSGHSRFSSVHASQIEGKVPEFRINSAYSSVFSGLSYLSVGFLPPITVGFGRLESGFAAQCTSHRGLFENRTPRRVQLVARHPQLQWSGRGGRGIGLRAILALAGSSRCKFRFSHAVLDDIHGACFFRWAWGQILRPARDMRSPFRMHGSINWPYNVFKNGKLALRFLLG